MAKPITLLLSAAAAAVLPLFSCVVEEGGAAEVRYTWEWAEQLKIERIYASYNDVKYWRDNVYEAYYYDLENATDFPMYGGSGKIPDNIYRRAIGSTWYKGDYLPIQEGKYTAVCSGEDGDGYFDIVANYEIAVVGGFMYFEVAFDVGALTGISGGGDKETAWFFDSYDNPDTPRLLKKASGGRGAKRAEAGGVVYYVFRRP